MGIQVPPDSTGKTVETNSPDGVTQRQVVTVGDKTTAANTAAILASGAVLIEPGGVNVQPISGSVTANVGSSGALALDATLTGGTQKTKLTDGTNVAAVKAASTAAGATDPAVVVAVSPNNSVAVTGTFWQGTQPVSGTIAANVTPAAPTSSVYSQVAITFSTSGDNTVISGTASQTIRVFRIFVVNSDAATATNLTVKDSTPTSFSGAFRLTSGGMFSGDGAGDPLFVTASGKGFVLNSSSAVQLSGTVWYTKS